MFYGIDGVRVAIQSQKRYTTCSQETDTKLAEEFIPYLVNTLKKYITGASLATCHILYDRSYGPQAHFLLANGSEALPAGL